MMASSKLAVFTIVFGVAYAAIYVISTELNLPLLTYHPVIGEVDFLWTPERRGPAMYWYGWMLTSLIGAVVLEFLKSRSLSVVAALVVAAAISFFAPTKWNQRLWPGWVCVVPIGALGVLAYYLTPYFTR